MNLVTRSFEAADAAALTVLLHRAYAELGARGLNYTAVDQDEATTLSRASDGASWVVLDGDRIVGTMTVAYPLLPSIHEFAPVAVAPDRAWLAQFAVDPDYRGQGIARALRDIGYQWCRAHGLASMGLDTAVPAHHLVALYRGWGYESIGTVRWPGKRYDSVIMVRPVPEASF